MFPPNTRILIVDDMMTMRKLVKKSLTQLGFSDITEAKNGKEAWEKLEQKQATGSGFQLVISDWNMPELTGLEFLKKVRSFDGTKALPFVLLTAEGEKQQIIQAVQAGVTNYILKPFTADKLKEKLEQTHQKVAGAKAA